MIGVPRIDGKTTPRDIPLFPPFAHLLWEWSTGKPLVAKTGEQWPATGQSIEPNMPQFPGYCADGQKRCWDKSISALAYLGKIHEAEPLKAPTVMVSGSQTVELADGKLIDTRPFIFPNVRSGFP